MISRMEVKACIFNPNQVFGIHTSPDSVHLFPTILALAAINCTKMPLGSDLVALYV
jgi:hypothetical protein